MNVTPNQIIELLRRPGAALPEDVRQWLLSGFTQYIATGQPLCRCLGLRHRGRASFSSQERLKQRNQAIAFAMELVPKTTKVDGVEKDLSTWARLEELAKEIRRFDYAVWPRVRDSDTPPSHMNEIGKFIFMAHKLDNKLPQTVQGLRKALNMEDNL